MNVRAGLKRLHIFLASILGLYFLLVLFNDPWKEHGLMLWGVGMVNALYWGVAWIVAGFLKGNK